MMRTRFGLVALIATVGLIISSGWNVSDVGAEVADTDTANVSVIVTTGPVDSPSEVAEREVRYLTIVIDEAPDQRLRIARLPNTGVGLQAGERVNMYASVLIVSGALGLGGVVFRYVSRPGTINSRRG